MTPEHIAKLPYRKNVGIMLANEDGKVWAGQRLDAIAVVLECPGLAWVFLLRRFGHQDARAMLDRIVSQ